jgi:uncharacterized DUF497 family protein
VAGAVYEFDGMKFSWNEDKAAGNEKKHSVTFEEAATAFADENAQLYDDIRHSNDEKRFVLIGYSKISRLLIVCHCYRGSNDHIIRIISARKADKRIRAMYEKGR